MKNELVAPFLKWVGGKRQLMPEIVKLKPATVSTYYEPFIGGGAVLFELQPQQAIISDINPELINVYQVVKYQVEELIDCLKNHQIQNSSAYFYQIRNLDRNSEYPQLSSVQRAARMIYLNKTCFNGLYRVNSLGEFNTPFGDYKKPNIVNELTLRAVSDYLNQNQIQIVNQDYRQVLSDIDQHAFVYFDPPYDPISQSACFTSYTHNGFNQQDQIQLSDICHQLTEKGIKFLLSNSATPFIKNLYKKYKIKSVKANRSINSVADKRGSIEEVLIRNYD